MYSIRRRFRTVTSHLDGLIEKADKDKDFATPEAFSATYSVAEKLVRRVLMHLIVRDASCKQVSSMEDAAGSISSLSSFKKLAEKWRKHEPNTTSLESVIGKAAFATLNDAFDMRSSVLHGEGYPGARSLRATTRRLREIIEEVHKIFGLQYGFSGWQHKR